MDISSLLGDAAPTEQFLTGVVSDIAGHPVTIATATGEPVPYDFGSPATACLARLRGTTTDGTAWSVFVKVLQHPRHWPGLNQIPPPRRQEFCEQFPWRTELSAWEPAFTDRLPPGLRVPVLYRLAELPDDRLALWMEDVIADDRPWTTPRFVHAARLLGAFASNTRSRPSRTPAPGHIRRSDAMRHCETTCLTSRAAALPFSSGSTTCPSPWGTATPARRTF